MHESDDRRLACANYNCYENEASGQDFKSVAHMSDDRRLARTNYNCYENEASGQDFKSGVHMSDDRRLACISSFIGNLPFVSEHKGWYRRKLPHLDIGEVTQFITFSLDDCLPQDYLQSLRQELKTFKGNVDRERDVRIQKHLDQGSGSCVLRQEQCALIVRDSLLYHHEKKMTLLSWVIMPNHVHFLARFEEGQSMSNALQSLKSYTGHEIKKLHPELKHVWHEESFDRYIRNEEHLLKTTRYILENPVKARLCREPSAFRWSSTHIEV